MRQLKELRRKIDTIDEKISANLEERREVLTEIARYKKRNNIELVDTEREMEVLSKANVYDGVVFRAIMDSAKDYQAGIIKAGTFGLISEKPVRSLSPMVHSFWGDYEYLLCPTQRDELENLLKNMAFDGFNVTMPYKKIVFEMCDQHSPECFALGNVNTVKRELDGTLTGYNTDYFGVKYIIEKNDIDIIGRKVVILGTGGVATTAKAVMSDMGASNIYLVSRDGEYNYSNTEDYRDVEVLVNCTPVGMYPFTNECPLDISSFQKLEAVIDVIYNPYRTQLILDGEKRGLKTATGLEMLVAQAGKSAEIFCKGNLVEGDIEDVIDKVLGKFLNRCLIGMPGSGKSFMGRRIANVQKMPFRDMDSLFKQRYGKSPAEYIVEFGESRFRTMEGELLEDLTKENGQVIATGGGIVERPENLDLMRQNSVLIWVQRDLDKLPTNGRPISEDTGVEDIYKKREPIYREWADFDFSNNVDFKKSCLVINGPNLNLLGKREQHIYGDKTYEDLERYIQNASEALEMNTTIMQSNHEGDIVDAIQEAAQSYDGIVINPAGYGYTSVAILDAIKTLDIPVVEVHISNIEDREEFRRETLLSADVVQVVVGQGFDGYKTALEAIKEN